jgi:putative copper export protein
MADIRVEQKSGGRAWLWVLIVIVLLIAAALLLDRAGYIDLPINLGQADGVSAPAQLAAAVTTMQEALHGQG